MIVSGGKILGIHKVEHDNTFSGDGVRTPLGLDHGLLEEIRSTSAKLDKSAFDSWTAQTEHWDIDKYTGGDGIKVEDHEISVSAKYLTSGDLEPYATQQWVKDQKYITSAFLKPYAKTQWVQEELYKKQNLSDMSAYAQSAWVDENFQPKGNYITPEYLDPYATSAWVNEQLAEKVNVSAMSAYATSAWVDKNFLKEADYHEYSEGNDYVRIDNHKIYGYDWTSAVSGVPFKLDASAFEQYSAWANGTYLKDEALKPYATSAGLDENQQYAMTNSGWAPVDIPDDTVISGTSGISVQKIGDTWVVGTSAQYATSAWVQGALDKKQDVSAMSAYATSAWVEENFSKLTLTVSYDAQSEELHLDFSPLPIVDPDIVLLQDWMTYDIGAQLSSGTIPTVEFDADGPLDVTGTGWSGTPYINQASLGKVKISNWTENTSENLKYNLENLLDLSQDWTFECWIKQSNTGNEDSYNMPSYMTLHKTSGNMSIFGSFKNAISCMGRDMEYEGIKSDTTNWHHICVIRYSGTNKLYVDGTLRATNTSVTFSNDLLHFIIVPRLWAQYSVSDYNYRYLTRIAQVCLTKRAKWTDNFTPPTRPYCLGTPRTQVTE